jgi:hypothetical protein
MYPEMMIILRGACDFIKLLIPLGAKPDNPDVIAG